MAEPVRYESWPESMKGSASLQSYYQALFKDQDQTPYTSESHSIINADTVRVPVFHSPRKQCYQYRGDEQRSCATVSRIRHAPVLHTTGVAYSTETSFRLAVWIIRYKRERPTHVAIGNQQLLQSLLDLTVTTGTADALHALHQGSSGAEVERLPCIGPAAHERRMGGQDLLLFHLGKMYGRV